MFETWRHYLDIRKVRSCSQIMIVAHPDDETFWGGATLASSPNWGVVCLTNRKTKVRRKAFKAALKVLGATGVIYDIPDRRKGELTEQDTHDLAEIISHYVLQEGVTKVVTHSPDGETGHKLHKAISNQVAEICPPELLYYFSFANLGCGMDDADQVLGTKLKALEAYLGPAESWIGNDALHAGTARYEKPVHFTSYKFNSETLRFLYQNSSIPIAQVFNDDPDTRHTD